MRFLFLLLTGALLLSGQCLQPVATITVPAGPLTDTTQNLVFTANWSGSSPISTFATDLSADLVYQYCPDVTHTALVRPAGDGTFFASRGGEIYPTHSTLYKIDAASNVTWSLGIDSVNPQLTINLLEWNHDAIALPNGQVAVIAYIEQLMIGGQCGFETCDVLGDAIIVVDQNGTVQWVWNSFDYDTPGGLPWSRAAILGETCMAGVMLPALGGCPVTLAAQANDWLHANSLYYDASDGNLIVSLRNQDWVIKIAYANGAGDGHVIWHLGKDGDFALENPLIVPYPWFSHQHDAEKQYNGQLSLLDNGNTRHDTRPNSQESRGQVWTIDEAGMTATLTLNFPLGDYSPARGNAQLLSNGNWWFYSGDFVGGFPSQMSEFTPDGTLVYQIEYTQIGYRAFRLSSLFNY